MPHRAGVPFCLPHKKEPKKVTAQGTGLSSQCKIAALVERTLRNLQPMAVTGHPLFEARRAELRGPRLEARILVSATTAAKFLAYFLTAKSRASLAK